MELTAAVLKDHCQRRGLKVIGQKKELVARLKEYLQNGGVEINSDVPAVESRDSDLVAMDMAAVPNIDDLQRVLQALKGAEVDETLMALKATELKAHCEHYDLSTKGQKKKSWFLGSRKLSWPSRTARSPLENK